MRTENNSNLINTIRQTLVAVIAVLLATALMTTFSFDAVYAADKANAKTKITITEPKIQAGSAVVYSASTSQLVYAYHEDRKVTPGDLTKIMTAMIVIDNMHSKKEFNAKIEVTSAAASKDKKLPAAGETVKLSKLLEMMLVGGSDAATDLLVSYSTSSLETFVNQMNAKASSIGLMDTQFANATGAYSTRQYSSAYDCAVIVQYALRYEPIKKILMTAKNDIEYGSLEGSMQGMVENPSSLQYMGFASEKDMQLVVVMLDADGKTRQKEAKSLLNYGYKKVTMNTIVQADKKVGKAKVRHGARTMVPAYTAGKGYAYIPPEGSETLVQTQVVMYDDLVAPLEAGSKVGEYRIYVADELKGTVDLVIKKDVGKGWPPSYLYISNLATVLCVLGILLILYIILRIRAYKRKRRRMKELKRQQKIREAARRQLEIEEDRKRRGWTYHN